MKRFDCITVEYFKKQELLLWRINETKQKPKFCLQRLEEFKEFSSWVKDYFSHPERPVKFIVSTSEEHSYAMRDDVSFIIDCIKSGDKSALTLYAYAFVEVICQIYNSFGLKALTMTLVEGDAYGSGFECALAHDFILAEERAKFCLPESKLCNMFPGMGAYSLLYRKLNTKDADAVLTSRKSYKAIDLFNFGCVNKLIGTNNSIQALFSYIEKIKEQFNFEYYHAQCKKTVFTLTKKELLNVTDLWIEACMNIDPSDLYKIDPIENTQSRKVKIEA